MALKKSELYSSLWQSCDELRGGMDASQYKDYVLVLLFMKYVSDKAASQKGYLLDVPKGGSFADMVAVKNDKEIGDKINKIIAKLAEANDLTIIKEADFNDDAKLGKGKEMVDRLSNLVGIFENLELVKKPPQCLEYILVHELAHLLERHHNEHFIAVMDEHLPQWRQRREELNAAPLAHATWSY